MPHRPPSVLRGPAWALAASALAFLAFLPALQAGFVNWDDDLNFLANPAYRGLGLEQLRWMLTTFHMGPWQPLAWLTLGLDYTFWGMDPRGYHLTSVLIHALNAALFYAVALRLFERVWPVAPADLRPGALLAALLFAVHPLRVESVAWITERRDVVSGCFFLLALLAYLEADARRASGRSPGAWGRAPLIAFALSLLGKATGVTGPFVLLILDIYPLRRLPGDARRWWDEPYRRVLVEKIPYLALAGLVGLLAIAGQKSAGALRGAETIDLGGRLALTVHALGFYLQKLLLPTGLSALYERQPGFGLSSPSVLAAGAALLVLTLLCVALRRRWPAGLAAWSAYVLMALPVSGIAAAGHQLAADRYTYFACLPWPLLIAGGLVALVARRPALGAAVRVAGVVGVALLAGLTFAQARTWHDSTALWAQAARVDPRSDKAAMNLASALVEREDLAGAEAIYRARLAARPGFADAHYSLGMVLLLGQRQAEAESEFRRLVAGAPAFAMGHYGLGIALMQRRAYGEARAALEEALRLAPGLARAREALAEISRAEPR